ncbi:MAG TPA: helical backbone metal receptor [Actinomycetota bacterium]|nr:helical backbone metal receptor [Actinomycetota bacterium]
MRPSRFIRVLPLLLTVALFGAACSEGSDTPSDGASPSSASAAQDTFPLTLVDDDGVEVTIEAEPQRIVTFAPSMTETLFALGVGERIVGVSGPSDDYPAEAAAIEQVGGAGEFGVDPNVERVVALEPDLFLTISGGDAWKAELRDLGVPIVTLDAVDFADLLEDIRTVGELTGTADAAETLADDMAERAEAVEAQTTDRVTCFFEVYFPPLTTVGPDTFLFDLLELAGCDPVTADATSDYPEWSVDDLVADGPEVYLATPESAKSPAKIAERPGFGAIPAVASGSVVLVDGDLVTRPGPRVIEGLEQLAAALHAPGD